MCTHGRDAPCSRRTKSPVRVRVRVRVFPYIRVRVRIRVWVTGDIKIIIRDSPGIRGWNSVILRGLNREDTPGGTPDYYFEIG